MAYTQRKTKKKWDLIQEIFFLPGLTETSFFSAVALFYSAHANHYLFKAKKQFSAVQ